MSVLNLNYVLAQKEGRYVGSVLVRVPDRKLQCTPLHQSIFPYFAHKGEAECVEFHMPVGQELNGEIYTANPRLIAMTGMNKPVNPLLFRDARDKTYMREVSTAIFEEAFKTVDAFLVSGGWELVSLKSLKLPVHPSLSDVETVYHTSESMQIDVPWGKPSDRHLSLAASSERGGKRRSPRRISGNSR